MNPTGVTLRRLKAFSAASLGLLVSIPMLGQEIDIPFKKYVLDNGLTLIVHEDHKAPIVAVNVWYHVGSKNENPGKTGFAHLFEHLMFNGSENFDDDYFIPLEKVGATDMNGTTNSDRTNYFQNVPTPALDLVLWMESDRMGHMLGAIDQAKLDEQRGVVQNEKRQGENRPYGVVRELLTKNTYPEGHPYSWTTIGSMEDLDAASLEDVQEWFQTYYGAANGVISIAGDVDPEQVKARVEHFFGDIPAGPPVPRQRKWIAKRTGVHRQTVEDRVPQARIYKVWNIPEWGSIEADYLNLISDVLALGKTSRFYKRLVYEEQIATDATAYVSLREIGGQFVIIATVQPGGDLEKVEAALDEELDRFLAEGPSKKELQRVKTQYEAGFLRGIERIGGFGGKSDTLATNEVYAGDPNHYKVTLERMRNATAENLRDTARRWLSDGVYILEVHPYPSYSSKEKGADRSTLPNTDEPSDLVWPKLQKTTLSNGLRVILAERHETPIVEFELLVDAGFAADQFARPGVASLAAAMLDEGTQSRSSLEISEELSMLGASLRTSANLDSSQVSLSALKKNLEESLAIFADVIQNPVFPASELDRLRKQQLARIGQEKSNPISLAQRLLPGLLYGGDHAYGNSFTGTGTEESVKAIDRDGLEKFHRIWFQPSNATLIVVGDTTLDEIVPKLESHCKNWKDGEKPPEKNLTQVENPKKAALYLVDKPDAQQSMILGGLVTSPSNHPDRIVIDTMNSILGGTFTARINMNLREDKHWSYGARSFLPGAQGQRPWIVYAAVQTDKTKESMIELNKELREILDTRPATAEELDKAKRGQTLRLPGRFETKRALRGAIGEIVRFDLPEDYYQAYPEKVRALKLDDIQKAANEVVEPERVVWVVVGDRSNVEKGLREIGFSEVKLVDEDGNSVQ